VFFEYKHDGKKYKFKKRDGVNRIKNFNERIEDIKALRDELERDLFFGWNPLQDPKRIVLKNPYYFKTNPFQKSEPKTAVERMSKAEKMYYNKH
jgi:hypothetical protein